MQSVTTKKNYINRTNVTSKCKRKDEAIQNAERLLEKLKIDTQFIKLHSVSNTIAASSKSPKDEKGEQFPTSVNVNFNYELDGLPLFGSGAKTQVSYINNDQAVEILHFYRTPKQDGKTEVITPEKAVQQVVDNYRFAQLKDSERNTGEITDVTLGYFTASPTDLQRYLVPVYKVKGSVSTPALENYEFNLFVIASTESQDMAKRKGQTNQALETVFN